MDCTGKDIISKLARLGQRKQGCLQWIPSHVAVPGNEAPYEMAGTGCDLPNPRSSVLSHSEIHYHQTSRKDNRFGVVDKLLAYGTEGTQIESSYLIGDPRPTKGPQPSRGAVVAPSMHRKSNQTVKH
ncbi:nup43 [Trichonephila clavipes]|nr:nup43 [Trichonephila clavipes]